ncbi:vitrin-like [Lineus longissimus]|uniref:vitrin-like n=1 Tax=Lineus longissimus TaxID=88925 RepID=UPI002B4D9037
MKLLMTLLVVATVMDLSLTAPPTGRNFGSFIGRTFLKNRAAVPRLGAVPRVSVQANAAKLDQFLMKTFATSSITPQGGSGRWAVAKGHRPSVTTNRGGEDMYDVLLVMDSSGSIGSEEFIKAKQFMTDIVSLLPSTISRDNTRIACISFSEANKIKTEFGFLTHTSKSSVIQAINRITYQDGSSTHTTQALQRAKTLLETTGRRGAQKALFIATDGRSNGGGNPAVPANQMKNSDRNDVKIVVVAVSHNVNVQEVQSIASAPAADHVYYVNTFTEATQVMGVVRHKMMSRGMLNIRRQ